MSDLKLSDGREITFDFKSFTRGEFMELFDKKTGEKKTQEVIARASGLTVAQYLDMNFADSWLLVNTFWKRCNNPLADPNSESASS